MNEVMVKGRKTTMATTDCGADPHSGWVLRGYHERVAAGLCGLCGKVPEIKGRALCNACSAKNAEYCRTRYHTDVARRRCVCCHEPLRETECRRMCFRCRMADAERVRIRKEKKKREQQTDKP